MKIFKLITYTFDRNVGPKDRIFRILSGLTLAATPWISGAPQVLTIVLTVAGLAWFMTGVVSRCGAYYLLGLSTWKKRS